MKNDMLGVIFSENPEASMGELTSLRALAAVPDIHEEYSRIWALQP